MNHEIFHILTKKKSIFFSLGQKTKKDMHIDHIQHQNTTSIYSIIFHTSK